MVEDRQSVAALEHLHPCGQLLDAPVVGRVDIREHLPKKKFLSGIARMRGGGGPWALPELKNTIYIFIFDGRKRCTNCPKEGEGGGGNLGNARKKTFFFK